MAWIDDRIWCHPKLTDLPAQAKWAWVASIAYSSGFHTRGLLTTGQQQQIGANARVRGQLINAGLWDELVAGTVRIHDWDNHNDKRDERRAKDRLRKREQRARERGTSAGSHADNPPGRRALKEVKEVKELKELKGFPTGTSRDDSSAGEQPLIESITPNLREIQ